MARLAEGTGIKVVCIVDQSLNSNVRKNLEKYSYRIVDVDLSWKDLKPEDVIELARENGDRVIWDVTNGYDAAFESIVMEIRREAPDWLITPLGAGEAFVGLHKGLKRYLPKTKLVGAGVHRLRDHELELRARCLVPLLCVEERCMHACMTMKVLKTPNGFLGGLPAPEA